MKPTIKIYANYSKFSIIIETKDGPKTKVKEISIKKYFSSEFNANKLTKQILRSNKILGTEHHSIIQSLLRQLNSIVAKQETNQDPKEELEASLDNLEIYLSTFYETDKKSWERSVKSILELSRNYNNLVVIEKAGNGTLLRVLIRFISENYRLDENTCLTTLNILTVFASYQSYHQKLLNERLGSVLLKICEKHELISSELLQHAMQPLYLLSENDSVIVSLVKRDMPGRIIEILINAMNTKSNLLSCLGMALLFMFKFSCYHEVIEQIVESGKTVLASLILFLDKVRKTKQELAIIILQTIKNLSFSEKFRLICATEENLFSPLGKLLVKRTKLDSLIIDILCINSNNENADVWPTTSILKYFNTLVEKKKGSAKLSALLYVTISKSTVICSNPDFIDNLCKQCERHELHVIPVIVRVLMVVTSILSDSQKKTESSEREKIKANRNSTKCLKALITLLQENDNLEVKRKCQALRALAQVKPTQLFFEQIRRINLQDIVRDILSNQCLTEFHIFSVTQMLQTVCVSDNREGLTHILPLIKTLVCLLDNEVKDPEVTFHILCLCAKYIKAVSETINIDDKDEEEEKQSNIQISDKQISLVLSFIYNRVEKHLLSPYAALSGIAYKLITMISFDKSNPSLRKSAKEARFNAYNKEYLSTLSSHNEFSMSQNSSSVHSLYS